MSIADFYKPIADAWASVNVPSTLHPKVALAVARELLRFGECPRRVVKARATRGNRRAVSLRRGVLQVNPERGWKELVHDVSHWVFLLVNPAASGHCEAHAALELSFVQRVIARGWLHYEPPPAVPKKTPADRIAERASHAERMLARAERRLKLAQTLAKKWRAKVRYYAKKTAGGAS